MDVAAAATSAVTPGTGGSASSTAPQSSLASSTVMELHGDGTPTSVLCNHDGDGDELIKLRKKNQKKEQKRKRRRSREKAPPAAQRNDDEVSKKLSSNDNTAAFLARGKQLYENGRAEEALKEWNQSLMSTKYIFGKNVYKPGTAEWASTKIIQLRLLANVAAAHLSLRQWQEAADKAGQAVHVGAEICSNRSAEELARVQDGSDGESTDFELVAHLVTKARYRGVNALRGQARFDDALKAAAKIGGPASEKLRAEIARERDVNLRRERRVYGKVMNRRKVEEAEARTLRARLRRLAAWCSLCRLRRSD